MVCVDGDEHTVACRSRAKSTRPSWFSHASREDILRGASRACRAVGPTADIEHIRSSGTSRRTRPMLSDRHTDLYQKVKSKPIAGSAPGGPTPTVTPLMTSTYSTQLSPTLCRACSPARSECRLCRRRAQCHPPMTNSNRSLSVRAPGLGHYSVSTDLQDHRQQSPPNQRDAAPKPVQ
jgi:hypothetical protein